MSQNNAVLSSGRLRRQQHGYSDFGAISLIVLLVACVWIYGIYKEEAVSSFGRHLAEPEAETAARAAAMEAFLQRGVDVAMPLGLLQARIEKKGLVLVNELLLKDDHTFVTTLRLSKDDEKLFEETGRGTWTIDRGVAALVPAKDSPIQGAITGRFGVSEGDGGWIFDDGTDKTTYRRIEPGRTADAS